MRPVRWAAAGLALAAAAPAWALPDGWLSAEVASDHRRRGLSWSEGRAAAEIAAGAQPAANVRVDGSVTTLRGSARHGGADAVIDLSAGYSHTAGSLRLDAGITGHVFAGGRGRLNFVELGAGAGTLIGPLGLDLSVRYAPEQAAIGGDNLYVSARTQAAVIGTPFTVSAGIGRSMGSSDDTGRAERLRPGGSYTDWSIGVDRASGPLTIGIAYVGNDAASDRSLPRRHRRGIGDTVVARLRIGL